ncbi:ThiF family adenylyltransferase [Corynebacterium kroppenstedtii]|uniref:Dinucleotide-utilizing enzyme involved in thiamine biosynthesis n=1 Tax=Corynebacterium kroppenstedtii (strain DSM 44385 / JCM 11950 / CIP 105744 / CCUG 35717) TaxID=645127 RepID=C4LKT0_CORK4|nr:ThiF family adenylyltransferase [Corynebacterium kroppenstedtii]ACR18435.1 dinucleotide-utilizing enzyme involved in thiamine biosynthesis [Corynebacterium kroppenstedtii DSM 44385]QRP10231.1 ThiF family adenylyltransferase [Corynebacterium kroppenstedtii]
MPSSSTDAAGSGAGLPPLIPDERLAPLPHNERVRTARHLALFDEAVQQRFAAARMCVIGAGGLGSPLLYALAAAGVGTNGHITVCDDDVVDFTNLQRQTLFGVDDVGRPKADVARERMHALNPSMRIRTEGRFGPDNAEQLCHEHDLLIDGSDNFATRFVAADAAEMTETPLVWGAVLRYEGQVSVFWAPHGPGLRDLFDGPPTKPVLTCAEAGVLGATTAVIGNLMATEALKIMGSIGEPLVGRVLTYNATSATTRTLRLRRDPSREPATTIRDTAALSNAEAVCEVGCEASAGNPLVEGSSEGELRNRRDQPQDHTHESGDLAPSDLPGFLADENHVLLDVREDHERLIERITLDGDVESGGTAPADANPRDIHVPLGVVKADAASVRIPKSATAVAVYCARGARSQQVADILRETLSIPVYSLAGGITAMKTVAK